MREINDVWEGTKAAMTRLLVAIPLFLLCS
jgi:hypothetical protein